MPKPLDPDHPIAKATDEDKKHTLAHSQHYDPATKLAEVTLSGFGIQEDGRLRKSKYFNILTNTMDDYSDVVFTKEEAQKISSHIRALKHGAMVSMPIMCAGPQCIFAARCPYEQMGKAPIGRQCIWELNLMKQWQLNYLEEYDIDPDNFTEMTLVNELVEVELHLHRCNLFLAMNPEHAIGVVDQTVGVDKQGNAITQKQISQHLELREKLYSRKHRLIKYLVGDRQEKYKKEAALKTREARDPSSSMAQLKEQMEALQRQLVKAEASLLPIQGQVVDGTEENVAAKTGEGGSTREGTALHPDDIVPDDE